MRILLDECLDRRLAPLLTPHDVVTVAAMGWDGLRNGELLREAQGHFDVFLTVDRNLPHQQHVSSFDIAIIILVSRSNRRDALEKLIPDALVAMEAIASGTVVIIPDQSGPAAKD